jgi:CheY-like chemotaxis protein
LNPSSFPTPTASVSPTAAQRALYRILETTIPDRTLWERAVRRALLDAELHRVPDEFPELLLFARHHLAAHLGDRERPWLVTSVLEDLEAEAEMARLGGEAHQSARMAVATRAPQPNPSEPASHSYGDSSGDSHRDSYREVPSSLRTPRAPSIPRIEARRPAILVVDQDRFQRAALARTLVQARCDVAVLDGGEEALAAITGNDPLDAVILDVDGEDADALLGALATARPNTPVIAWTNAVPAVVEHVARVAGVNTTTVVARSALTSEIFGVLRRLLDPP